MPTPSLLPAAPAPGTITAILPEYVESSAPSWWRHVVVVAIYGDYVVCRHLDGSQAEYPISIVGNADVVR